MICQRIALILLDNLGSFAHTSDSGLWFGGCSVLLLWFGFDTHSAWHFHAIEQSLVGRGASLVQPQSRLLGMSRFDFEDRGSVVWLGGTTLQEGDFLGRLSHGNDWVLLRQLTAVMSCWLFGRHSLVIHRSVVHRGGMMIILELLVVLSHMAWSASFAWFSVVFASHWNRLILFLALLLPVTLIYWCLRWLVLIRLEQGENLRVVLLASLIWCYDWSFCEDWPQFENRLITLVVPRYDSARTAIMTLVFRLKKSFSSKSVQLIDVLSLEYLSSHRLWRHSRWQVLQILLDQLLIYFFRFLTRLVPNACSFCGSWSWATPGRKETLTFNMILFVQVIYRVLMTHSELGYLFVSCGSSRWKQFALLKVSQFALGAPRTVVQTRVCLTGNWGSLLSLEKEWLYDFAGILPPLRKDSTRQVLIVGCICFIKGILRLFIQHGNTQVILVSLLTLCRIIKYLYISLVQVVVLQGQIKPVSFLVHVSVTCRCFARNIH